ncbi:hypothetical protein AGLY_002781 [Aphis glycines]|uniref:Uncharacterized protein n=1 Tax=Aphis glycines TaxID=307491 RepID=A0A6G0U260_APHGL|nr:hypothetical protein AGLY_002781 [Aphis glycines]
MHRLYKVKRVETVAVGGQNKGMDIGRRSIPIWVTLNNSQVGYDKILSKCTKYSEEIHLRMTGIIFVVLTFSHKNRHLSNFLISNLISKQYMFIGNPILFVDITISPTFFHVVVNDSLFVELVILFELQTSYNLLASGSWTIHLSLMTSASLNIIIAMMPNRTIVVLQRLSTFHISPTYLLKQLNLTTQRACSATLRINNTLRIKKSNFIMLSQVCLFSVIINNINHFKC